MRTKSPWLIFLLVAVAQFMVVLDVSITNVALPSISEALNFQPSQLQWVVTGYALTFGGFLLLGGRAADLFGHRKILIIGLSFFTLFSLLISLSTSPMMLVAMRALQGMAAALMSPAALSIVIITFAEGTERNRALGYWTTISTGGAAAGLLLGGVLTQYLGWEANFFVNVPIGIAIIFAIFKLLPTHETLADHSDLDLLGAILVTAGLVLFVYVISLAPEWGWLSKQTLGYGGISIALLLGFIWNESRQKHPLMPLSIFKVRNLSGANIMMAPIMAGMFGMFFLISLYIQVILQYPPVTTGLSFLPFPIILGVLSPRLAPFVSRYGYKPFLIIGPSIVALSMAWLIRLPVEGRYVIDVLPNIVLMPIGLSMTFMPLFIAATSGVRDDEAGLASGLINTSQQMGGAIGLAILSSVAASVSASRLALGIDPVEATVIGYRHAFAGGVLFVVIATVLGLIIIKQTKRARHTATAVSAH